MSSNTNNEAEALRAVIADETLSNSERRDAASHLIELRLAALPPVSDTDPEVVKLLKPWDDPQVAAFAAGITNGRSLTGYSLDEAKAGVARRHKEREVFAVIVDTELPKLLRIVAIERVMASLPAGNSFERNAVSPQEVLRRVKGSNDMRWQYTSPTGYSKVRVSRPPLTLSDVWD